MGLLTLLCKDTHILSNDINFIPKNIVKSELKRKGLKVKDLVQRLEAYDEVMSVQAFNNKMTRNSFSAIFFLKCLDALNVSTIRIKD